VDPTHYFHNFGMRMLATQLAEAGHQVEMVFALGACPPRAVEADPFLDSLARRLAGADLVGVSVYTNYLLEAEAVTGFVKDRHGLPVVWGGVHATVMPEESLAHADYVVVGEGEDALVGLVDRLRDRADLEGLPNLWRRGPDGASLRPVLHPLQRDLDEYGFPMYLELDSTWIAHPETRELVQLTEDHLVRLTLGSGRYYGLPDDRPYHGYLTMASRGCPNRCAYCINNAVNRLFERKSDAFRFRSVPRVIDELETVRRRFPFLDFVFFFDDNFCARPLAEVEAFCRLYRERIGVPFKCNVHPNNLSEEKIDLLVEAGLVSVEMGIESGSARINREVYTRPHSAASLSRVADLLAHKHRGKVVSYYDVIMDNPWETHEDVSQTIRLVQQLPRPFHLSHFSLTFFPGTALYDRAVQEGIVTDLVRDVVLKRNNRLYAASDPYSKLLLSVSPFVTSRWGRALLSFLAHPLLLRLGNGRIVAWAVRGLMRRMIAGRIRYNAWRSRRGERQRERHDAKSAA
ncbi:MAG: radical SAM protein, partial [Candidatus Latescibacterota bacterium]